MVPVKLSHAVFDTALGPVGIAWSGRDATAVLHAVQLPAADLATTHALLLRRARGSETAKPEGWSAALAGMIRAYAGGEAVDFSAVPVAFGSVEPLRRAIYDVLRTIAHGETITYGALAARIGRPGEARMIGQAMGRNPVPLVVPCHRVVAAAGAIGGFSAPGGAETKRRMLMLEGALGQAAQGSFAF